MMEDMHKLAKIIALKHLKMAMDKKRFQGYGDKKMDPEELAEAMGGHDDDKNEEQDENMENDSHETLQPGDLTSEADGESSLEDEIKSYMKKQPGKVLPKKSSSMSVVSMSMSKPKAKKYG